MHRSSHGLGIHDFQQENTATLFGVSCRDIFFNLNGSFFLVMVTLFLVLVHFFHGFMASLEKFRGFMMASWFHGFIVCGEI